MYKLASDSVETAGPVVIKYSYPPNKTIPSRGATSSPAFTARALVTVNRALGSRFIFNGRVGEVVFDFPAELKLVDVCIVPRVIPKADTMDWILVTSRAAVKGFAKLTVTSLILFVRPVVDKTVESYDKIRRH